MKQLIITIIITISNTGLAFSQNANPELISASGGYFEHSSVSLSWSIGECLTETYTNGNSIVTQGFNQPDYKIDTLIDNLPDDFDIIVYPNPTPGLLNIKFLGTTGLQERQIQIFDMQGKLLVNKLFQNNIEQLDLSEYPNSTLILKITDNSQVLKLLKIQKIN